MRKRQSRLIRILIQAFFVIQAFPTVLAACSNQAADRLHSNTRTSDSTLSIVQRTTAPVPDSIQAQKLEQIDIYSRAIAEYINALKEFDGTRPDTLFFGKHEEFPDLKLPSVIGNTPIILLTAEEADHRREHNKTLVYINMFGWITTGRAEFILVTFFPGYRHQFDYFIDYTYDARRKEYVPENIRRENYIYNTQGKPERIAVYTNGKYTGDKPINDQKK